MKTVLIQKRVVHEPSLYLEVGTRIRKARKRKGWTLQQLGMEVGHSRASINNIELGHQRLPIHLVYNLALVFGIQPKVLLP